MKKEEKSYGDFENFKNLVRLFWSDLPLGFLFFRILLICTLKTLHVNNVVIYNLESRLNYSKLPLELTLQHFCYFI